MADILVPNEYCICVLHWSLCSTRNQWRSVNECSTVCSSAATAINLLLTFRFILAMTTQHFQHKHHQVQRSILGRFLTGDHKVIVGWHDIPLAESRHEVGLCRWRRTDTEKNFLAPKDTNSKRVWTCRYVITVRYHTYRYGTILWQQTPWQFCSTVPVPFRTVPYHSQYV